MPRRIQLSRKKGFRLPAGATVVSRPTKWGNPYRPGKLTRAQAVAFYRRDLVAGKLRVSAADARRELRGHALACWCPLDGPCHADVLLKVAAPSRRQRLPECIDEDDDREDRQARAECERLSQIHATARGEQPASVRSLCLAQRDGRLW